MCVSFGVKENIRFLFSFKYICFFKAINCYREKSSNEGDKRSQA